MRSIEPDRAGPPVRRGNRRGLLAGVVIVLSPFVLEADDPPAKTTTNGQSTVQPATKEETDASELTNWIEFSGGKFFTSGDGAQFMRRQGKRAGAFGGIEEFHWERFVGERGLLKLDGRGLFDENDYLLKMEILDPERGWLRAGYKEFRTYYDGSGGFFPPNRQWFELYDDEMALDRGEAWFEGGLTLPSWPEISFEYRHVFREGMKDSTVWGDTTLTGGAGAMGIVPSFWRIDEKRDIVAVDMKHSIANTDFGVGVRAEWMENDNGRYIHRRPGEAADRFLTHKEGFEADLFNARAFTETRFNDKALFTTGYSFTTLDTEIFGSRIYGADYEAGFDPTPQARNQTFDEGFFGLGGGSSVKQHVVNLNCMFTPWEHFVIVPSVRVENMSQDGIASFTETTVTAAGGAPVLASLQNTREYGVTDVSERLELRYTGFRNWSWYARGEWLEGRGDLSELEQDFTAGTVGLFRQTESSRFTQKYVAGANWYPARKVSFGAQYYHKIWENRYDHPADSTLNTGGNRYPAFIRAHDFKTDDLNWRMTLRPTGNVTLVSRYDFQHSTVRITPDLLPESESADMTSHILSQSVSWTPFSRLSLMAAITYTRDTSETAAERLTGAAAGLVRTSENDYWFTSANVLYVLTERTDLQAGYTYYRAGNYVAIPATTLPLGAGAEEHGVTFGITRMIHPRLRWAAKYGFYKFRDQATGGFNNFSAHLLYSSVRYSF